MGILKVSLGAGLIACFLASCGDNTSDPKAVALDELTAPYGLRILDGGDGTATLVWRGQNNQDDFSGYNIYGIKKDTTTYPVHKDLVDGRALQFLDEEGEVIADTKNLLEKMSYDVTANDLKKPADKPADLDADEYSFLPIHTVKGEKKERVFPTCRPDKVTTGATCVSPESSKIETFNGETTYQVPATLAIGSEYCFVVVATMDDAEKISQMSSEVRCFRPRKKVAISGVDLKDKIFSLKTLREKCASGTCAMSDSGVLSTVTTDCGSTTVNACFEIFSGNEFFLTAGNSPIVSLGVYQNGFSDSNFPAVDVIPEGDDPTQNILLGNGYTDKGMSIHIDNAKNTYFRISEIDNQTIYDHILKITSISNYAVTGEIWIAQHARAK